MKRYLALTGIAAIFPLLCAGCLTASEVEPTRYYTITPALAIEPGTASEATLGLRPLLGARPYKLDIAYSTEPNRLAYFYKAEWAELPATMIDWALLDALTRGGLFRDVGDAADMVRPDYMLTGELRRFEADFTGDVPRAVVEVRLTVRRQRSGEILWEDHLTAEVPLEGGQVPLGNKNSDTTLAAVAQGLSQAVSRLAAEVAEELRERQEEIAPVELPQRRE